MRCSKCGSKDVYVTNSYSVGESTYQKRKCACCGCIITTQVIVLNTNPGRGEGACALARKAKEKPGQDRV